MRVSAVLIIKVTVDCAENLNEVSDQLKSAADKMAAMGMLTREGPTTVDTWDAVVYTAEVKNG